MTTAAQAPQDRVELDRVRALYATVPVGSTVSVLVVGLWAVAFAGVVEWELLLAFCGLILLAQLFRVALFFARRGQPEDAARAGAWARHYSASMLASGLVWGAGAVLFFGEADPARQLFILAAAFGISSATTVATVYHPPAIVAFVAPLLVPLTIRVLAEGGLVFGLIGIALVLQLVLVIVFGLKISKLLRESLQARYDNLQLIEQLRTNTEAAESAQRKAEQASAAKSQFFAAASHDLRQPLQALGLFAASLRESERDAEGTRRMDQILSSVDALESLFDELLDISKLDAGYVRPVPVHFNVRSMFERLETAYSPLARENGLALVFEDAGAALHTDSVLVERVLGNFISNALRYTHSGGVTVRCRLQGDLASLEVADTGPGIPHHEHERVFDEFYQLGNPERDRRKGLGLGLATVRRIGIVLASRVTLDSEPGRGSVFSIEVPVGDHAQVAISPGAPSEADVDALRGKVIGVVDDERDVREGLAEVLGIWRCQPVVAASALELCAQLDAADIRPDAFITDYRLKEHEDGAAAVALLRERYGAQLPALIMTGDTSPEIFRLVREQRLPLLSKPVRASRLRAALQHLLSSARPTGGTAHGA
ncbi:MAG: hybrid sensor histidine kinase/response regulator [Burkholderiales bacterium]|nr:hybrid sensor histidine kinase/response regulator [Burkholderiales bacterium]